MALYRVEVISSARQEIRALPGNMRQRVLGLLKALSSQPRPESSKCMDTSNLAGELPSSIGLYRIRVESWRVVYVVEDELQLLTVLTVRKRPPYQYENLRELLEEAIATEEE
ncbi:type II toxin-antitoxin system RelE/ParE family toxin [Microcoleus sp. ARI1-B5]|uniref:type II toxin-antitoxin system RelE family toxin n=1 Tax=unclassified Microcoleus TaxID=2642155 RepID=UPI002FCECC20